VRWTTRLARGVGPFLSSKASYDVASNICQALCDGPSELLAQVEGLRLAAVHHWQGRGREPKRLGAGGRGPGAGGPGRAGPLAPPLPPSLSRASHSTLWRLHLSRFVPGRRTVIAAHVEYPMVQVSYDKPLQKRGTGV